MEEAIINLTNLKQICVLMLEQYDPVEQSYRKIAELHPWSLLLTGNQETLQAEDRCGETIGKLSRHLPTNHQHVKIARQSDRGADGRFIFERDGETKKEASAQDFHGGFGKIVEQLLSQRPVNVLMDITSLELDAILHIQHFFNQFDNVQNLYAMYTSPQKYVDRDNYKLRLNEIAQPPGYISLRMDESSSYAHVFMLGFDNGRALRFFDLFDDWKDHEKYAIISDPPYVSDGAETAKQANSWIEDLEPEQIFTISGFEPLKVYEKLQELYQLKRRLDIIPLGPKPMLLDATRFYFSLNEQERNNVRILYDFPQFTTGATSGIDKHYLFPCSGS